MGKIRIGYDDNLGLAKDFQEKVTCDLFSFHDLSKLILGFEKGELDAIFVPAGTLPYLSSYVLIAQAIFTLTNNQSLQSIFVTTKSIKIHDIANFSLGRVNRYCTTSYWAPLIYLMRYLTPNTMLNFHGAQSFEELLHKTAQGKLDGSMVWDIILQNNPADAAKVHTLFSLSGLPAPVMIAHQKLAPEILDAITQYRSKDSTAYFVGFDRPDIALLGKFAAEIKQAIAFYQLQLN